ncbi:scoloptoxin SSD14 isoform X1 [Drosophila sulfurigaster albostrigata]|uniref:scoloptoxin SSD14 isoform X1 n=2 Tax=Drosophila sulfurigaster albostrigata TaxID=89887 RepID=UPI002D219867|nr:scoloptoxin SSD14 isoform X1 [Drosophila sulfurigaster albostrigata]
MHSTACGVGASATNLASLQTTCNSNSATATADAHKMVHHSNDDAMNKIPLKSASGLDDEEKNGGELMQDTAAAEEARREQMRANMLAWMKKLTIGLICFIGIALISYVIISLCFSDWPKSTPLPSNSNSNSSSISGNSIVAATTPAAEAATTTATMTTTIVAAAEVAALNTLASRTPSATATGTTRIPTATATEISTTSTNANSTHSSIVAAPTATTAATTLPTTTTTTTSSTSNTFITSTPTDEQPLPPAATAEQHNNDNDNMEATTTATGDLSMAGPAVAASTSPTTPPPSAATKLDKNQKFESTLGVYQKAAVCSDSSPCSQIGSDILAKNGSAVDAAIATMLCNGLLTAQSMGIGGGHLMNIYDRQHREGKQIDAHVVAPYAADQQMYDTNPNASFKGPLSIAVPGEVMGYHLAHQEYGKLPWRDLVAPSLKLCETGYHMTQHQENSVRSAWSSLKNDLQYQAVFLNAETGGHYVEGDLIKSPKQLCNTYQLLADNGPMDFYNGTIAEMLAEDLRDLGSIITQDDLNAYTAEVRLSDTMPLGEDTLYAVPPVSSGSVVSHILSILEGFNFTRADLADDESYARTVHRITEALKFGFASRSELGDPRFNDVRELVSQLNNPENAANKRAKINDSHVLEGPHEYGAQFSTTEDPYGTSHLAVLAPNGDAVSVTSSINYYFGSGLIGSRTGIILNNGMNDFALSNNYFELPASPANTIDAHKRPMSSQSPMLLTDREGNIKLAIGAAGGTKIIPAIVEVAARFLWFGDDLKAAVDAPRFYNQLSPDSLDYEEGSFTEAVLQLLAKRGHKLKLLPNPSVPRSTVCAIGRNSTGIYANADRRKRGHVAGF